MKNNLKLAWVIAAVTFISCNPAGTKIGELPVTDGFVNTSQPFFFKKGEKIALWCQASGKKNAAKPLLKLAYQLNRNGKLIDFQKKTIMYSDVPNINSSYSGEEGTVEADYLLAVIPVIEEGNYTVDAKILEAAQDDGETAGHSFSREKNQSALLKIRKN